MSVTDATALSSLASSLASAVGGLSATDLVFSTPGGVLTPNAGTGVSIAAAGAFSVDQALVVPNALLLTAAGSLTIACDGLAVLLERQRDPGADRASSTTRELPLFRPRTAAG